MEEVGELPSKDTSGDTRRTQRNYDKCEQCRNDRKKCERDDPVSVCARCAKLGHDCSPSSKVNRKRKRGPLARNSDVLPNSINGAQEPDLEAAPLSNQTMVQWNFDQGVAMGSLTYGSCVNTMAQKLFARARRDIETCMALERAPTRVLVTSSQQKCQNLHDRLSSQIDHLWHDQIHGNSSFHTQRHIAATNPSDEILQSFDPESRDNIALICSANIFNLSQPIGTQFRGPVRNRVKELPQSYYLHAEAALKDLMTSISQESDERWSGYYQEYGSVVRKHGPFPASHIAFLNMDYEAAFQLWQNTQGEGIVVDILGRSFPHLVAEAGNSDLLGRMSPEVLKAVGYDARGLSLLDLGVIGDSTWFVSIVISKKIVDHPVTEAMQRAIIGRRLQMIKLLLKPLELISWDEAFKLNILAELAGQNDFFKERDELERLMPAQTKPQAALNDLDALASQLNSDELIIAGASSFDSTDMSPWSPLHGFPNGSGIFDGSEYTSSQSSRVDAGGGFHDDPYAQLYPPS